MAKKEPLYPHVPKSRKKGTNAWRCLQCGRTTWNIIRCPKCGSKDLKELTSEEVASFYETGKPVIHPRTENEKSEADASVERAEERRIYYCALEEKHPHREVVQVHTTQRDPECPYCRGIMTYGAWWPVTQAEE